MMFPSTHKLNLSRWAFISSLILLSPVTIASTYAFSKGKCAVDITPSTLKTQPQCEAWFYLQNLYRLTLTISTINFAVATISPNPGIWFGWQFSQHACASAAEARSRRSWIFLLDLSSDEEEGASDTGMVR